MASSTTLPRASTVAATRSIASRARSGLLTLTSDISQLPGPRNWAMAGGSNWDRARLVRHQLTPGLILALPGTARLRPSISFFASYPAVRLTSTTTSDVFYSRLLLRRRPLSLHDIQMFGDLPIGDAEDIHSHHRFRSPSESGREW